MRNVFGALCAFAVSAAACAAGLTDISNRDAAAGLREALVKGSQAAVARLGVENGFFGDERLRIPMPDSLKKTERLARRLGMGKQADELVLRMNRAAEAAVPEAKALLVDAVKQMSVQDAKAILTGGDDAATQYFKRTMSEPLAQRFQPVVSDAMQRVKVAEVYDRFAGRGARLGLVRKEDANLEDYITRKALEGLFLAIAEEEINIRRHPMEAASGILRKVFGAIAR